MAPIKIGFVLLSNSQDPMPSTRISVLNMFPFLRGAGFDPQIVFEPAGATETPDVSGLATRLLKDKFPLVYFQKVRGPRVESLVRQLSAADIRTVYGVCDLVDARMADATDRTIVVTDYLKSLYPGVLLPKIHVVHDGIERPEVRKIAWGNHQGSRRRPLHAVLVTGMDLDALPILGTPPDWLEVSIIGRYPVKLAGLSRLRRVRWKLVQQQNAMERLRYLRFLSNRRIRCSAWDPVGVYSAMQRADIGIIPIEAVPEHRSGNPIPSWMVKSENRLTMKMCVGLPVVASPIPSYEPVIEQGTNGFLATLREEWNECLSALRDPVRRQMIGEQARESVLKRYSMQNQSEALIQVLRNALRNPQIVASPVLDLNSAV